MLISQKSPAQDDKVCNKTMKATNIKLNPYRIYWAIFVPERGIVTKVDSARIGAYHHPKQKVTCMHYTSKEAAIQSVSALSLSKKYRVFFITDKQFSMVQNGGLCAADYEAVATTMQRENAIYIGD